MSSSEYSISPELAELLAGFIDDKLTSEQSDRLAEIIQSDPEARALYLDHCRMHATLAWEHGVLGGMSFPEEDEDDSNSDRKILEVSFLRRFSRPLAWAASLTLLASVAWMTFAPVVRKSMWNSADAVGTVIRKSGAPLRVENVNVQLVNGGTLRLGSYELSEGITQFILDNDVEVLVEAPAWFRIISSSLIELKSGRLSVKVSPEGQGFTVKTPNAEIVDYGTEIGVEVGSQEQSEVHVFKGEVEVNTPEWLNEPVRLYTDQATLVDTNAGEPIGIAIAPDRFLRTFEEPVQAYFQEVHKLDPVAYYRMSISEDGRTLLDRSGNNLHGRINRGTMINPVFACGRIGNSLRLEGPEKQAYAVVEDYPKAMDNQISVAAWVYANSRPRWASIAKNWSMTELGQFHLGLRRDTGKLEVQIRTEDGGTVFVMDTEVLPIGSWQHVGFVVDSEFARLYRNGKEVAHAPCTTIATPELPFLGIGAKLHGEEVDLKKETTGFWDGMLDELAIFNDALTPRNMRRLHEAVDVKAKIAAVQ